MKKNIEKFFMIIVCVISVLTIVFCIIYITKMMNIIITEKKDKVSSAKEINSKNIEEDTKDRIKMEAVILKVNPKCFIAMDTYDLKTYRVYINKQENRKYKKGQEVAIYASALIKLGYVDMPSLSDVTKIEIIKQKTDIAIPDEFLDIYNSKDDKAERSIEDICKFQILVAVILIIIMLAIMGFCISFFKKRKFYQDKK